MLIAYTPKSGYQTFSDSRFQYAFFFWDIEGLVKVVKDEG